MNPNDIQSSYSVSYLFSRMKTWSDGIVGQIKNTFTFLKNYPLIIGEEGLVSEEAENNLGVADSKVESATVSKEEDIKEESVIIAGTDVSSIALDLTGGKEQVEPALNEQQLTDALYKEINKGSLADMEVVENLLKAGANPNGTSGYAGGSPALINAISMSALGCAEILIKNGANVNFYGSFKATPLDAALIRATNAALDKDYGEEMEAKYLIDILIKHNARATMQGNSSWSSTFSSKWDEIKRPYLSNFFSEAREESNNQLSAAGVPPTKISEIIKEVTLEKGLSK